MIEFSGPKPEIVRIGVCYDVIKDHSKRFWDIEAPSDPGALTLPSGHLKTLPPWEPLKKLVSVAEHIEFDNEYQYFLGVLSSTNISRDQPSQPFPES